jgi:hypothetical protein
MAKEWKQLEKQDTVSGVAGQANYALPSDFERLIRCQIESGSTYYEIYEASYDTIRESLNAFTGNARPNLCCVHYQQLWFDRLLDDTYTIRLDFIYRPADMSGDSDTSPFPEHILEEYAYAFLMRDLGHDKKFADAYNNFKNMLEEYAESDGRGQGLEGFYDGVDGVWRYWNESLMWGGKTRKWHQG